MLGCHFNFLKGIARLKYRKIIAALMGLAATSSFGLTTHKHENKLLLQRQPGFFRFTYESVKMPNGIQNMGLLGLNYYADLTPSVYAGIGTFGAVTGSQGGLFTFGFGGGLHHPLFKQLWGDVGLDIGGGGGRASLVGGGLLVRPHIGLEYDFRWMRVGLQYSYVNFPSGEIHSSQIGLNLDIPYDFYYICYPNLCDSIFKFNDIHLSDGKFLDFQRNDFGLILQAYFQRKGTLNVSGEVQDGTMSVVGAELDHYVTNHGFIWLQAGGAFSGVPNGFMDILGGLGYHAPLGSSGFAIVPQFGVGAGGGGNVDTGGGVLIEPEIGFEVPLTSKFSGRISGGYLWAPQGQLSAATMTGEILYHLDIATANKTYVSNMFCYTTQGWRIELFNQTYVSPQRSISSTRSSIEMIAIQIDQLFTPHFFFSYQGAGAYSGFHAGGYATGMIGPGIQTSAFCHEHLQPFAQVLIGAGGGGGLALGGGSVIEPVVGLHYALTQSVGLMASVGQIKAINNSLNTPVLNVGMSVRFGTLNRV